MAWWGIGVSNKRRERHFFRELETDGGDGKYPSTHMIERERGRERERDREMVEREVAVKTVLMENPFGFLAAGSAA